MKITDVTPYLLRGDQVYGAHAGDAEATDQGDYLFLVRVQTDEGLEGWADVETLGTVAAAVVTGDSMGAMGFKTLREVLVGQDPLDIAQRWQDMYIASAYYGRRGVVIQCISAIDNCLWSIAAQAAGAPLVDLLGGRRRDRLQAYASTLFRGTPEANAEAAAHYVSLGFTGVKFGWGGFGIDDAHDRDCLQAIREALGPDRTLMVDPGWYVGFDDRPRTRTRQRTVRMLETITDFDTYWVEDFVHPDELGDYRTLHADFPTLRFAAGEQQATRWDFARLMTEGHVDVLQPDLSRCGGLTTATQVAPIAAAQGIELVTHSWLTDLLHGYSLHLLAALPEATWVEFNVAQSELSSGVVVDRMSLAADGTVAVPDGVGIGVEVDEAFVTARDILHRS
jgi:L-alanine-DL-glutamate epimerase-like enolase superfamily enzyme